MHIFVFYGCLLRKRLTTLCLLGIGRPLDLIYLVLKVPGRGVFGGFITQGMQFAKQAHGL